MFDLQFRAHLGGPTTGDIPLVLVRPFLLTALTALCGTLVDSMLENVEVHGYQNPLAFSPDTEVGDLTESAFPGYNIRTADFSTTDPGYDDVGTPVLLVDPLPWQVGGDPASEILAGVYLLTAEGRLIGGAALPEPLALSDGLMVPMTFVVQLDNS